MRVTKLHFLSCFMLFFSLVVSAKNLPSNVSSDTHVDALEVKSNSISLQGTLEILWGDPNPLLPNPVAEEERIRVAVVADGGLRYELNPKEALQSTADLYSLLGKRVDVVLSYIENQKGIQTLKVNTIIPVASGYASKNSPPSTTLPLGNQRWVTLMCKFPDIPDEPKPVSFFQSQYGNNPGQLDHYWREVSYNKIDLIGSTAYTWVTLPDPYSYYVNSVIELTRLARDCADAADQIVDFSANGGVAGINMMFNSSLGCCAWGGRFNHTLDGVAKSWPHTLNPPWAFNNIAPLVHEMGHAFGLPHSNNSDNDTNTYDNPWDLMSDTWSNATTDPLYGVLPKHINMNQRDRLGWVDDARKIEVIPIFDRYDPDLVLPPGQILAGGTFTVDRASLFSWQNLQLIKFRDPNRANIYYTVEVRDPIGTYEGMLAGKAVIVHEVDTTRGSPAWSVDSDVPPATVSNNEGSMFKLGETWYSPSEVSSLRVYMCVAVEAETTDGFVIRVQSVTDFSNGGKLVCPI